MTRTAPAAVGFDAPPPPRRARTASRAVVLGVLLACAGAALGWYAYSQATAGNDVVAMARRVPYGATITDLDLRPITIPAGSTLRAVAWDARESVVGHVAMTDLLADELVVPDAVGTGRLPRPGEAIVGVPAGPGQMPASGLATRDEVQVVRLDDPAGPILRATVLAVGDPDASGRRTVDLVIAESSLDALARAAGDDRTVLVLVSDG